MESIAANTTGTTAQENVRKYFLSIPGSVENVLTLLGRTTSGNCNDE
jgi:hypothetical protein